MIFTTIEDFKVYVGGAVNQSLEIDSINPTVDAAFEQYLRPWLGDALSDAIIDDPSAFTALMPNVKRALAKLTMYKYSKIGAIQFSETGMHRVETDNVKSAYKYQEEEYALSMLEEGFEAIEQLLRFLDLHEADYADWTDSDAYQMHNAFFLRYASEMRRHYSKYVTRYAYESMRAIIEQVECFAIEAILPPALYALLKTNHIAATTSAHEKKAVNFIQKAITEFTIYEAMQRLWVKVDGDRIVHHEHVDNNLRSDHARAEGQAISLAMRHHNLMANRWINKLLTYITDNPEEFPNAFCTAPGNWIVPDPQDWTDQGGDSWTYNDQSGNQITATVAATWQNSSGHTWYMIKGNGHVRCFTDVKPNAPNADPCCQDRKTTSCCDSKPSCGSGCAGKKGNSAVFRL